MAGSPIRPIVRPICQPIIRGINTLVGGTSAPSLPSDAVTTDNTADYLITDAGDYIIQG